MTIDIHKSEYEVMGGTVHCESFTTYKSFKLEDEVYAWLKRTMNNKGWRYTKLDEQGQAGIPDCLLLKGEKNWLIEVKMLKRKKLTSILDNLHFEPGQIPWMLKALKNKERYLLLVAKDNHIILIGEKHYVRTMLADTDNS